MIKPLGERILAKPVKKEQQTQSGIYVSHKEEKKTFTAEVIDVGEDDYKSWIGKVVYYKPFKAIDVDEHILLEMEDVIGYES